MPRVLVPLPDRDFDVTEVADEVAAALARPEDYLRGPRTLRRGTVTVTDDGPAFVVQDGD